MIDRRSRRRFQDRSQARHPSVDPSASFAISWRPRSNSSCAHSSGTSERDPRRALLCRASPCATSTCCRAKWSVTKSARRWNETAADYPQDQCLHRTCSKRRPRAHPDAIAVIADGERALAYAELNRRANRLAHYLRARGRAWSQRVAICIDRGAVPKW
ncbi:AMP-binding protein [Burkholderia pseudomallei]|uniref:AMP-binding protein n=1 Tax=Burkholderia pseudomallei TaxID=28450 RepID=UPI00406A190E